MTIIHILRPMNISNRHVAGLCPRYLSAYNVHRSPANEHFKMFVGLKIYIRLHSKCQNPIMDR